MKNKNTTFVPSPRTTLRLTKDQHEKLKDHAAEVGMKASIARHCEINPRTVTSIIKTGKGEYKALTKVRDYIVNIIPKYATL